MTLFISTLAMERICAPLTDDKALEDIKRLLVLLLIKLDSTSDEIALALQVDSSVVRKMMSSRQIKRVAKSIES